MTEVMPKYRAFLDVIYDDLEEARRLADSQGDYMAVFRSGLRNEILPLRIAEKAAAMDDGEIMAVAAPGLNVNQVLDEVFN